MSKQDVLAVVERIIGRRLDLAQQVKWVGFTTDNNGRKYAVVPSASEPGKVHYVNGQGCDCKGFSVRGYCSHSDAVCLALQRRYQRQREAASLPTPTRITFEQADADIYPDAA